jgi:DNA-directed RNA polymerase subunit alpha
MLANGFQRPKRVEIEPETLSETYGKFVAQPFERGFATTLGNALRRCLLSSIEGAAITAVKIEGVPHEFSSIPGVVEDVTDIILNLKQIPIRIHTDEPRILTLEATDAGAVKASALTGDPSVEIVDGDVHVATINEDADFRMQLQIRRGRGYISAEKNIDEDLGLGWIPVDSAHSPVRRVNYRVEAARLGRTTDYERLVLEVWTNGTITPEEGVSRAAQLLKEHLGIYVEAGDAARSDDSVAPTDLAGLDGLLGKTIDELDLSVRSANCLKNANIHTLRDLVRRSEKDMLETKNFGRKSLEELQDLLSRLGLSFGMDVPDRPGASA